MFNVERLGWGESDDWWMIYIFTQRAQRAQRSILFSVHAGAGVGANFVTTRGRREFIHPLPLRGLPPVSGGRKWVMALAVVTDCPPETGGTSEAEGVDSFPFSVFTFPF